MSIESALCKVSSFFPTKAYADYDCLDIERKHHNHMQKVEVKGDWEAVFDGAKLRGETKFCSVNYAGLLNFFSVSRGPIYSITLMKQILYEMELPYNWFRLNE